MRRALWRSRQGDPTTGLGRWWWAVRPRVAGIEQVVWRPHLPGRRFDRLAYVICLLCFGFAAAFFTAVSLLLGATCFALTVVPFLLPSLFRFRMKPDRPELAALLPDPAPAEAFPVRLVLRRRRRADFDDAFAIFDQGWLHVEGLHTSFSLRAADVGRLIELWHGGIGLELPDGQRLELRPLGVEPFGGLVEAVRIWHYYVIESPPGESLLPPLQ